MFRIMLVDDEMPTIRFLQAIIERHLPEYTIVHKTQSAVSALEELKRRNDIDLLVTDINMPCINGIELAAQAREIHPGLRTVLVSGHSDFEYAKSAISVGVEEYLLKPIHVETMVNTLKKVAEKLSDDYADLQNQVLNAIIFDKPCSHKHIEKIFDDQRFYFVLMRSCNLSSQAVDKLLSVDVISSRQANCIKLSGREEGESFLLMDGEMPLAQLEQQLQACLPQSTDSPTLTILIDQYPGAVTRLKDFVPKAINAMQDLLVVGRQQMHFLADPVPQPAENTQLSRALLKKLEHFMTSSSEANLKDLLLSKAMEWEKLGTPQMKTFQPIQMILHQAFLSRPDLDSRQQEIMERVNDLQACSSSYGELMSGLYAVLFGESKTHSRGLTPQQLFEAATLFIDENYMNPINAVNVCQEIGISQTYLSRLFRRFGDASFNTYLTNCRIQAAINLMKSHESMLLRDIAACVGYEDPSYFSKVFHQLVGMSPTDFIKKK